MKRVIGLVVLGVMRATLSPSVWAADKPFTPVVHVAEVDFPIGWHINWWA
ncbi:MAG TPA: hypothetical protein PLD79_07985 [Halothiobacillus sp.]|nr:hypothetical protein [Halothiobacillus sp.]